MAKRNWQSISQRLRCQAYDQATRQALKRVERPVWDLAATSAGFEPWSQVLCDVLDRAGSQIRVRVWRHVETQAQEDTRERE